MTQQALNKQKSKTAYAVKNHFKSTAEQRKKAKQSQVKKKEKPPMFKSAEDEVNAYMAELGLL